MFRILIDPVTGEAVSVSWHAWLPLPTDERERGKGRGKDGSGRGNFDVVMVELVWNGVVFDKAGKGKGVGVLRRREWGWETRRWRRRCLDRS